MTRTDEIVCDAIANGHNTVDSIVAYTGLHRESVVVSVAEHLVFSAINAGYRSIDEVTLFTQLSKELVEYWFGMFANDRKIIFNASSSGWFARPVKAMIVRAA
jgi:hypothetical protein